MAAWETKHLDFFMSGVVTQLCLILMTTEMDVKEASLISDRTMYSWLKLLQNIKQDVEYYNVWLTCILLGGSWEKT